jgi:hypothetical protein
LISDELPHRQPIASTLLIVLQELHRLHEGGLLAGAVEGECVHDPKQGRAVAFVVRP